MSLKFSLCIWKRDIVYWDVLSKARVKLGNYMPHPKNERWETCETLQNHSTIDHLDEKYIYRIQF
jgi:hypothetical protein